MISIGEVFFYINVLRILRSLSLVSVGPLS